MQMSPACYPYVIECTHLIPRIRNSDARSGFSQEFFTHLVTKYTLTSKLLHYIVMKLPDNMMTIAPYDAACISLKVVLAKTTESCVIKQLLRWGIKVMKEDIWYAAEVLVDLQVRGEGGRGVHVGGRESKGVWARYFDAHNTHYNHAN